MRNRNELSSLEKWERLTFADNFIFCKVMEESPEICLEMIELLLDIKVERVEIPEIERTIKTGYVSKGIRLDVYVKDGSGRCFDIEIQTSVAKELSLKKRARYYQGLMDVDSVFAGADYRSLNETYVIFLCLGDALGFDLPVYTFENICAENTKIKMDDGTHKIFFNARKYDTMKSDELKSFFKYLCGKEPSSGFTDRISAMVERVKLSARWRHDYMFLDQEIKLQADLRAREIAKDIAEDMARDMAEDIAKNMAVNIAKDMAKNVVKEAEEERKNETARKMLKKNIPQEVVAECTSLPLEKVIELQKEALAI